MPFVRVHAGDTAAIETITDIYNAARPIDDPTAEPSVPQLTANKVEFGWDLEPEEHWLYLPEGASEAVGVLHIDMPRHDNLQLVWTAGVIRPDARRQGHGTALMNEVLRRAREAGRTIIWVATGEDDAGAQAFLAKFGFRYASHDARRRQKLADVDYAEIGRLHAQATAAAHDYRLERLTPPLDDDTLAELIAVTEAINDAPMGELTYEDEKFDVDRLRNIEMACEKRGDSFYRVVARHKETGEAAGHTIVVASDVRPHRAGQGDTAVHREHRGHRLGMLLKIEMMHWLAEERPQLEYIETWNNADNHYMISVNEAIGYRLDRIFNVYELNMGASRTE